MISPKAHRALVISLTLAIGLVLLALVVPDLLGSSVTTVMLFYNTLQGRMISWFIATILTYSLLTWILPRLTAKTVSHIDDIILGILRWPLPLLILLYGLTACLPLAPLQPDLLNTIVEILDLGLIVIGSYLAMKFLSGVVRSHAEAFARRRESNLDDVLIPILTKRIIPLIIVIVTLVSVLYILGINLNGVLISIGVLSFLFAFLFQEPLSNLFGGMFLVTDVPFKYGDFLVLEDEKTYRVEDIGARVTRLYSTDDHTLAYMPNTKLGAQRLINLTRPNVELRVKMQIGVGYGTDDLYRAQKLLLDAANAHPNVLGEIDVKLELLENDLKSCKNENERLHLHMEVERLKAEHLIRDRCEDLIRRIEFLSRYVIELESQGLNASDRARIHSLVDKILFQVSDILRRFTIWIHLTARLDAMHRYGGRLVTLATSEVERMLPEIDVVYRWLRDETPEKEIKRELLGKHNISVLGTLTDVDEEFFLAGDPVWLEFSKEINSGGVDADTDTSLQTWRDTQPSWVNFRDFYELYATWHRPLRELLRRLRGCRKLEHLRGEGEHPLHDRLKEIVKLLEEKFPLQIPMWQTPISYFIGFGASSIDFRLEFFVDDLVRDHFDRLKNVFSEVGLAVRRNLKKENIEIPFPQTDVWFRNSENYDGSTKFSEWFKESMSQSRRTQ